MAVAVQARKDVKETRVAHPVKVVARVRLSPSPSS